MPDPFKIVSFCCNNALKQEPECSREEGLLSPAAKRISLPCSSKADTLAIIKAFEAGADAVLILACAGNHCALLEGSYRARKIVNQAKRLLDEIGLGGDRLEFFEIGSPGCGSTADAVDIMAERVRECRWGSESD